MAKRAPKARNVKTPRKAQKARKIARPEKAPNAPANSGGGVFAERDHFLSRLGSEHTVTLKVMRAFPSHEGDFQPHPRSKTAKKLMWTFVQEQALAIAAIDGTLGMTTSMGTEPDTIIDVIEAYETGVRNVVERLEDMTGDGLGRTVKFFVSPGQMGDIPLMEFLWMMLMDGIHHRGQLSVYLRMAGGLVPSIYGPSADEPWN